MQIEFSKQERRIINIIRGILMVFVVYIHSESLPQLSYEFERNVYIQALISSVTKYLFNAAVPLFMILSSLLLYSKDISFVDNIKKKLRTLLLPYIIINTVWILIFKMAELLPIGSAIVGSEYQIKGFADIVDCYIACINRSTPLYYPFWFLKELMVLNILAYVIKYLINKVPILYAVAVAIMAVLGINMHIVGITSLVFWSVGCYIAKNINIFKSIIKKVSIWLLLAVYLCNVVLVSLYETIIPCLQYSMYVLIGAIIIRICYIIFYNAGIEKKGVLDLLGTYSMAIFIFHEFSEAIIKRILMSIVPQYDVIQLVEYIFIPVIVLVESVFIGYIMKKCTPNVYRVVTGGR